MAVGPLIASAHGSALAQSTRGRTFTRAERRLLDAGEPVRRPRQSRQDGYALIGGNAWRVIPRPVDEVWRGLTDLSHLCQFLPQCDRAREVAQADGQHVMRITHSYGPITASYHVRMRFDASERDVAFRVDRSRPNDVHDAWGFMSVRPYPRQPGHTLVTWGIMAAPGSEFLTGVLGGMLQQSLLRVPDELYDYLVGPARTRYLR